jgi:hypothetical protein
VIKIVLIFLKISSNVTYFYEINNLFPLNIILDALLADLQNTVVPNNIHNLNETSTGYGFLKGTKKKPVEVSFCQKLKHFIFQILN